MSEFQEDLIVNQGKRLWAERKRLEAELAEYEAMGLSESERAMDIGQAILELDAKGAQLNAHQARLRRQAQPEEELTDAEFMAMSPEKMARRPEVVDRIFAKSKYYKPDQWNDPEVQKRMFQGAAELQRRKALGQ